MANTDVVQLTDNIFITGIIQTNGSLKILENIELGSLVELKRDRNNKYDNKATGVFTFAGQQIGWIPKAKNTQFAELLDTYPNYRFSARVMSKIYPNSSLGDGSSNGYANILAIKLCCYNRGAEGTAGYPIAYLIDKAYNKSSRFELEDNYKPQITINDKQKDNIMSTTNKLLDRNQTLATTAAFLEAGRIANGQATKLALKHLPLMARGYADTPAGRLLLANAASVAAGKLRPTDSRLSKLTDAMITSAYQELIQTFDIEKMIDEMLSNDTIKKALNDANQDEKE